MLLGPSGSGKSTLLNILGGLDASSGVQLWFQEQELTHMDDGELTLFRREHVGFVFQFYNLIPSLTAAENVQLVTEIARAPMTPEEALRLVGLGDRLHHFPAQLSGGEQQRVAIARAEISYILLGETALLTLVALPLGCGFGYALARVIVAAFETELYRVPFVIEPATYAWAMVIGLAATIASALLVRRRLDRAGHRAASERSRHRSSTNRAPCLSARCCWPVHRPARYFPRERREGDGLAACHTAAPVIFK